jgi:hypothetical protein
MTALHHYWLRRPADPVAPPANAVFAWPCFPSKLGVQGTGGLLGTSFPNSLYGKFAAWPWDGGPTEANPCELVMFRNSAEQTAQSTTMGPFARSQTWCIESRVGWSGEDTDLIVIYPLRWVAGFYVKYTPITREVALYVGTAVVFSTLLLPGLNSNTLHHWAATYSNGVIKIWINGSLLTTYTGNVPDSGSTGIVIRYENALYGELYAGGVRYWDYAKYTAPFTPPTQLTIP